MLDGFDIDENDEMFGMLVVVTVIAIVVGLGIVILTAFYAPKIIGYFVSAAFLAGAIALIKFVQG